ARLDRDGEQRDREYRRPRRGRARDPRVARPRRRLRLRELLSRRSRAKHGLRLLLPRASLRVRRHSARALLSAPRAGVDRGVTRADEGWIAPIYRAARGRPPLTVRRRARVERGGEAA